MFFRKFTLLLIVVLIITSTSTSSFAQTKRSQLQSQLTQINTDIDAAKKEFNNLESQKKDLNEQITVVQSEIKSIQKLIIQTQTIIVNLNTQIEETNTKITVLQKQMYKLYKEIQYSSVSSRVEVLLTSTNFSDFVTKLYGMTAIQDEAERVQNELKDNLDFLSEQKSAQQNLLSKQTQSKGLLNSKQSSLTQLYISTDDKQKKYEDELKAKTEAAKKVQEELTKLPPAVISYIYSNGGNPAVRGDSNGPCYFYETRALEYPENYFMTPTEGAYTNNFNCYPWSWSWQKNGHDGVDIANGTGTPILATADGTIYKKGFDFGNDVSIQHKLPSGQVVYSLYGHMSQPSPLAVGTKVRKGQFIGSMGSTGFSTGPHLHFMIISDTYEQYGPWCSYGNRQAKCYNPAKILGW